MGVLNVTPDSFADGGRYLDPARAVEHGLQLVAEGAHILDVGGESTRPGAAPVPAAEQLRRLLPVVRALASRSEVLISVDTSDPEVIDAVLDAGAGLINDVRALRMPGALAAVTRRGAAACLMHLRGEPATMQEQVQYADVCATVRAYLAERLAQCVAAGMDPARVCLDPGFGFGKRPADNLALLRRLGELTALARPVLVGLSRKSWLAALTGRGVAERLAGSVALATIAVLHGAHIVRAHDVAATVDALRVAHAVAVGQSDQTS